MTRIDTPTTESKMAGRAPAKPRPPEQARAPKHPRTPKVRLDQLLVDRGLAETRTRAQALLMAGSVRVGAGDGARADGSHARADGSRRNPNHCPGRYAWRRLRRSRVQKQAEGFR